MQDRGFYTVEQAADTLDLALGRIRQMLRGGDLEGDKEPGDRGWRITRESVEGVRRRRPPPRERGGATSERLSARPSHQGRLKPNVGGRPTYARGSAL